MFTSTSDLHPATQALHLAARKGDNDLVKLFIESGTRVDTQNVGLVLIALIIVLIKDIICIIVFKVNLLAKLFICPRTVGL